MLHGFLPFLSGFLDRIMPILVWFERSPHPAQVSRQSCPWPLKLVTSQAVEGTWIRRGGYGRLRGKWVKVMSCVNWSSVTRAFHQHITNISALYTTHTRKINSNLHALPIPSVKLDLPCDTALWARVSSILKRLASCKGIQDSFGFWIPRHGFRIPGTGFQSLSVVKLGFRMLIFSGIPDSLRFIPDSTRKVSRSPESGLPYTGRKHYTNAF